MGLSAIGVFCLAALLGRWLIPPRLRLGFLLLVSVAAVFALQASSPIRGAAWALPFAAVALTAMVWAVTRPPANPAPLAKGAPSSAAPSLAEAPLATTGALPSATLPSAKIPSAGDGEPSVNPAPAAISPRTADGSPAATALPRAESPRRPAAKTASAARRHLATAMLGLIIALLIILKTPALAQAAAGGARLLSGQNPRLASPLDLPWLGFSYLAFRLLHSLREYQGGRLPRFSLPEFAAYALFFPAYTAGPIDRVPRFVADLRHGFASAHRPTASQDSLVGGRRILWGVFKKFALADSLALIALNPQNAAQVQTAGWAWLLLLTYGARIYLDFSGYTDVALGLGRVLGVKLPENFLRPYQQTNLSAFWNSWHITLAQWFRAYYFNPLTRWLRTRPAKPPLWLVIFITQLSTMLLIGLWHGVTVNFFLWGAWHGLGLFIHNRFAELTRPWQDALEARPRLARLWSALGWAITFTYVMLGWVWFALPHLHQALSFFGLLFGFKGWGR